MSSLSQALHLDYLPSSHSAFQDHAAHNAGWSACLDPTAHGVPVYPRVLPHSSIMLHGARYVREMYSCATHMSTSPEHTLTTSAGDAPREGCQRLLATLLDVGLSRLPPPSR